MRVDHYQKPGHTQGYVLPILEYCIVEEDSPRHRFYLGREYYYHGEYEHALTLLHLYLRDATWQPEIQKARVYEAQAYWHSGEGGKAREACLQAVLLNPDDSEALRLMSELYFEPWKSKWARIAGNATNQDVLF
jgi:tetratricopeptide (TPR) repeat protein